MRAYVRVCMCACQLYSCPLGESLLICTHLYSQCGTVSEIRLIKTKGRAGNLNVYAYVDYSSNKDTVQKALALDRTELLGRPMFVTVCREKGDQPTAFKVHVRRCYWCTFVSWFLLFTGLLLIVSCCCPSMQRQTIWQLFSSPTSNTASQKETWRNCLSRSALKCKRTVTDYMYMFYIHVLVEWTARRDV